jgi:hypothetical protein
LRINIANRYRESHPPIHLVNRSRRFTHLERAADRAADPEPKNVAARPPAHLPAFGRRRTTQTLSKSGSGHGATIHCRLSEKSTGTMP